MDNNIQVKIAELQRELATKEAWVANLEANQATFMARKQALLNGLYPNNNQLPEARARHEQLIQAEFQAGAVMIDNQRAQIVALRNAILQLEQNGVGADAAVMVGVVGAVGLGGLNEKYLKYKSKYLTLKKML